MLGLLHDKLLSATLLVLNLLAPVDVHVDANRAYAAGDGHRADIYRPNGMGPSPVMVFLYGGGWRNGSKEDVAYVGAALARRGFVVVIPEYRHFPAVSLSDILTDNAAAVAWTIGHASEFGGDPRRVVVAGHSSGAWAAAMLGLDATWLERAGSRPADLAGIVGLAGPYASSALTDPLDKQVFSGADPAMQPINHAGGRHPALLLLTGAEDRDVRPSGTVALADRLEAGADHPETHIYPGLGHGAIVRSLSFPFSLQATTADDIAQFVAGAHAGP
ncbi:MULTISPECIES: alpha/beta hydrolase [unclassified Methylobacterium]|jgi:acetyl esterase/lipase|uniref:alpha/beta hydrolase n=1 Tax=unclassified Methylobacterium TaxID=2615210 RepID=UPI0013531A48|nr:alpha/beta hydrolase [Methylobacterium sp. 2A]MWV24038.1 alpha/beta hydrolase [Methylobacterium sp. 2A]